MSASTKYRQRRCKGCGSEEIEERTDSRWWLPGILVVKFKQPVPPERFSGPIDATVQHDASASDVAKVREILDPLSVKPPEWTFSYKGKPPSEANYQRFITFFLQPDVNVPEIAKRLRSASGVVHAAAEPHIAPPRRRIPINEPASHLHSETLAEALQAPLLDEPLAVSGGNPLGVSVEVGTELNRNQWYLFRSRADLVVNNGITGAGVVVADIDWGFRVDHQEFVNGRIKFKYNAATGSDDVSSVTKQWHGTGTLGLIGAGDNNTGMLGFASGADLWAIKGQASGAFNSSWFDAIETTRLTPSGNKRKVILIEAATDRGFNVESSTYVHEPIKRAIQDDCVVCVTAGNRGVDAGVDESNNAIPETCSILVGATQYKTDPNKILRGDSNWGPRVVISAPGASSTDVTCCDCGTDTYRDNFGGTSGAAAKVAGAMALLLQAYPTVTHTQIVNVLRSLPQISTADHPIGCFLDVPAIMGLL